MCVAGNGRNPPTMGNPSGGVMFEVAAPARSLGASAARVCRVIATSASRERATKFMENIRVDKQCVARLQPAIFNARTWRLCWALQKCWRGQEVTTRFRPLHVEAFCLVVFRLRALCCPRVVCGHVWADRSCALAGYARADRV